MASPAEPVTTEPTGALFRALRSVDVEPNLAYEAAEENRRRAGENVVAVLGAKIDAQGAGGGAAIPCQGGTTPMHTASLNGGVPHKHRTSEPLGPHKHRTTQVIKNK